MAEDKGRDIYVVSFLTLLVSLFSKSIGTYFMVFVGFFVVYLVGRIFVSYMVRYKEKISSVTKNFFLLMTCLIALSLLSLIASLFIEDIMTNYPFLIFIPVFVVLLGFLIAAITLFILKRKYPDVSTQVKGF